MSEVSVSLMTFQRSTHLRTASHSRPAPTWQKPTLVLLVVTANLLHHQLAVGADLFVDADDDNHSATAAMAADNMVEVIQGSIVSRAWRVAAAYDPLPLENDAATYGCDSERKSNVTFVAGGSAGNGGGCRPRPATRNARRLQL